MEYSVIKRSATDEFASNNAFERAHLGGEISSLGYGYVSVPAMKEFSLEGDKTTARIGKTLESFAFPPSRVVFSSVSLNPFINQLIAHPTYVVEIEKDYLEPCFDALRKDLANRVLLNPTAEERTRYAEPGLVCIYPLLSKSPVSKDGSARVEKLLADLVVSSRYRSLYSGMDVEQALRIIVNEYAVNYRTLFAYAARKRKTKEIYAALETVAEGQIKELLHAIEKEL